VKGLDDETHPSSVRPSRVLSLPLLMTNLVCALACGNVCVAWQDETKIKWRSSFTDVPDDGNCLMHAVWLGLKTLLQSYPRLKVSEDEVLPATAESFRKESIARMRKDTAYKEAVGNQLMLWVSVECDLLFGLEDFFCLPPEFQTRVIDYNQQVPLPQTPNPKHNELQTLDPER
jgi:hypothetical protein